MKPADLLKDVAAHEDGQARDEVRARQQAQERIAGWRTRPVEGPPEPLALRVDEPAVRIEERQRRVCLEPGHLALQLLG